MRAKDDTALEPEQEVLADHFDRFEHAPVDGLRDLFDPGTRMWGLRLDALADERLQAPGRLVEGVALGHSSPR